MTSKGAFYHKGEIQVNELAGGKSRCLQTRWYYARIMCGDI